MKKIFLLSIVTAVVLAKAAFPANATIVQTSTTNLENNLDGFDVSGGNM